MRLARTRLAIALSSASFALIVGACGSDSAGDGTQATASSADAGTSASASPSTTATASPGPAGSPLSTAPIFRTTPTCTVAASPDELTVRTDRGLVHGKTAGTGAAFLGIPFAKPPVGTLRFAPPADLDCWTAPRDATAYGSSCVQKTGITSGSEDCLFLNVWTPHAGAAEKRPVLFFIHGGAEVLGSANQSSLGKNLYDGQALATRENVVVVSTNYRLGPFGFLAHPALDNESAGKNSGNFALEDLIMALEWVAANAAEFGGDASRVMAFGESAGALNTCALVGSPLAKGRFASALMESGACDAAPLAYREKAGVAFAEAHGCTGGATAVVTCLRAADAKELAPNATDSLVAPAGPVDPQASWYLDWGPTVDGYVLPESPLDTITKGKHNHVPLVIGTNAHETELFIPATTAVTCGAYAKDAATRFGEPFAEALLKLYPCDAFPLPRQAAVDWSTDAQFACVARRVARAVAANQTEPVYRYLYTHITSGGLGLLRAAHATELPFVFDTLSALGGFATNGEKALSKTMQGYWARFGGTFDPNGAGAFAWPLYTAATETAIVLDQDLTTASKYHDAKCDFWDAAIAP